MATRPPGLIAQGEVNSTPPVVTQPGVDGGTAGGQGAVPLTGRSGCREETDGRQQPANVLLDSGAQISLITTSLAESLQLRGKNVSTTITKVGGQEEEFCTKMYAVSVRPVNKKQSYTIRAVGIPSISDDISEVNLSHSIPVQAILHQ